MCVCMMFFLSSEVNVCLQLKELEEAEAEAEKQVTEAREAEVKMEKERDEMLAWRAKAQRYLENFQASCKKRGVSEDIEHDQLKMDHPDLWREKNQLSGIQMRADKEKAQYDESMANLNQERAEVRCFCHAHSFSSVSFLSIFPLSLLFLSHPFEVPLLPLALLPFRCFPHGFLFSRVTQSESGRRQHTRSKKLRGSEASGRRHGTSQCVSASRSRPLLWRESLQTLRFLSRSAFEHAARRAQKRHG